MINCEWIRKQKKERPSLGSSPGPKCKPNVRLRVRCANTEQPCFSALSDAWLLRKRDEIRESSYIKYRAILERHIKPRLGSRRLGGICTASVDAFTRELLETDGLSVKTVHDILSVLHSVLKDTEARRPAGALAVQIRYPKGKRREMRVLTIEEQKRLVAYLLHPTDSCKFGLLLALYTGLRIGELCALRWSCIDLREQTIRIAATMQRLGGTGEGTRIVIGAPKSDSSLRTIPLPAQIAVLCRHMQPADPEAYVLTGGPAYMEPRTLQYRLKRYTAACGLEGVHAHTLRHTFATRAIESGFELKSLSEVLGHATTAITMERYVHSTLCRRLGAPRHPAVPPAAGRSGLAVRPRGVCRRSVPLREERAGESVHGPAGTAARSRRPAVPRRRRNGRQRSRAAAGI